MSKSKKITVFIVLGVFCTCLLACCGIIALLGATSLPWLPIACRIAASQEPAEPQVTYAEFPFTITYKLNGEQFTYEDAIICQYAGIASNEGYMKKYRTWKKSYLSGNSPIISYVDEQEYIVYTLSVEPAYLMGDNEALEYVTGHYREGFVLITHAKDGARVRKT